jgi:hypothetical protein
MNIILEWQSQHKRRKRGGGEEKYETEKHKTKERNEEGRREGKHFYVPFKLSKFSS